MGQVPVSSRPRTEVEVRTVDDLVHVLGQAGEDTHVALTWHLGGNGYAYSPAWRAVIYHNELLIWMAGDAIRSILTAPDTDDVMIRISTQVVMPLFGSLKPASTLDGLHDMLRGWGRYRPEGPLFCNPAGGRRLPAVLRYDPTACGGEGILLIDVPESVIGAIHKQWHHLSRYHNEPR